MAAQVFDGLKQLIRYSDNTACKTNEIDITEVKRR